MEEDDLNMSNDIKNKFVIVSERDEVLIEGKAASMKNRDDDCSSTFSASIDEQ